MRIKKAATATRVENLREPGRYGMGDNLWLNVGPAGKKAWLFVMREPGSGRNGKRKAVGLGGVADVDLKSARALADKCRAAMLAGVDPRTAIAPPAPPAPKPTFADEVERFLDKEASLWKSAKSPAQWRSSLSTYCSVFWSLPVDAVTVDMVAAALSPIWLTKAETARRVRARCETVFEMAGVKPNPAEWKGNLSRILPSHKAQAKAAPRGRHAAMDYAEVPAFMARLREQPGVGARALEFAIYGALRSGEARGLTWGMVDTANAIATIPAENMKAGKAHQFALTAPMLAVLSEMGGCGEADALVFPGSRLRRPMSDMTLGAVLKRMKVNATAHGFRSSFSTWTANETSFPEAVREACLAHVFETKVAGAYQRDTMPQKRATLLTAWANYIGGGAGDNVVKLRA